MARADKPRKDPPGKLALALRGAVVTAIIVGLIGYITIASTGALSGYPEITASVPASNAGVREQAAVEYKGVVVGKVVDVTTERESSTVTMRIYDRQAPGISKHALVRVLPRTLFGDQYVQLVPPKQHTGESISDGDRLAADQSKGTIQLYAAYVRLTELLRKVKPEKVAGALGAMAQLLDGRGEKFGRMIDQLYELTGDVPELLELADDGMDLAQTLTSQLAEATPYGVRAMKDAIAMSETLVAEKGTLASALSGGITLSAEGRRFLADNTDRWVQLMKASGPVMDVLAENPTGIPDSVRAAKRLLAAGIPTFQTGPWFKIRANLTTHDPHEYDLSDCPRYGSLAGPNCGGSSAQARSAPTAGPPVTYGGAADSVGSEPERNAIRELLRSAPGVLTESGDAEGALAVLVGPLLRGAQVITP